MGKTRPVGPSGWRVFLQKAEEFHRAMLHAKDRGDWNAVGLNAVHTVISAADAIVSLHTKARSSSEAHGEAADLVLGLNIPGAAEKAEQARHVLGVKDIVEYQARNFDAKEAAAAAVRATRFLEWVQAAVHP